MTRLKIDARTGRRTEEAVPDYTPAEIADAEAQRLAEEERRAKALEIRENVVEELGLVKDGSVSFGSAGANRCAKRILRALRFILAGIADE